MTDIVERARAAQHSILPQPELIKDLADEVERLRSATSLHHELVAALEEALDEFGISPNDCPSDHWAVRASALLQKAKQGDKQ